MENIQFKNADQIINMGGPWIGELTIDGIKIDDNIIIDNYVEKKDFYYFIKYFEISKKQKDSFFSVLRINKNNMSHQISKEKFEKIFIKKIENDTLYYCKGFHGQLPIYNIQIEFV
ncbi:hypothetical protein SAMN05421846_102248 [Chryseobacterium taeanense]|uniref:Uncharacterized protein n=1 Tax=Chryseobacterium taeanense TaxID=311334 RepID=A0A1G8FRL4_9FLAO|nr:hypothetical protein [Chryseobacterium taeanense]SDH84769.1 hypothetical protein SAMN05421846_102248 [Chryseobacterium taeanense]